MGMQQRIIIGNCNITFVAMDVLCVKLNHGYVCVTVTNELDN